MAKKKLITKVLSCLVVLIILMSMMPVSVFAMDDSKSTDIALSKDLLKSNGTIHAQLQMQFSPLPINGYDFAATSTAPEEDWNQTYGTIHTDTGYSVQQTSDGGYLIAGAKGTSTNSVGGNDAYLIKTYSNGNEEWSKIYGGSGWDQARSVQQTSDGGYIIAGYTYISEHDSDAYLIKTYSDGSEEWSRTFGGTSPYKFDSGYSVQQTSDGGYIITGRTLTYSGLYLVKTYAGGDEEWSKAYKNADDIYFGYDVKQTLDGGYIITGGTPSIYGRVYIHKTDSSGNEEWHKFLEKGSGYSVLQIGEDSFVVAGYTSSSGSGGADMYLAKLKLDYNPVFDGIYANSPNVYVEWERTYGGTESDVAHEVQQTSDGGYILVGYTRSFGAGKTDAFVVKTDSEGIEMWSKAIGGTDWDDAYSVKQTSDGGYIIAGSTESFGYGKGSDGLYDGDVWLIKLKAKEGESATISVTVKNNGGSSSEGYISVSFPNDETILDVSGTGDKEDIYPKGSDKLWGKHSKIDSSEDPLAELKELQWDEEQEETLIITVKPNSGSDKIVFYVRAALKNDAGGDYERDPTYSEYEDQQEWPVYRYSLDTCNIYPNLIITGIYPNENDKKIYYTIKNIGDIAAGPSYSHLYIDDMSARIYTDYVYSLQPDEERDLYFGYSYTCYGGSDTIKVCADGYGKVTEVDDTDNCKTITKECDGNPESLIVDVLNPEDDFSVVQGVSEIVKAKVTDNLGNTNTRIKY
jgi:hypothetical protein